MSATSGNRGFKGTTRIDSFRGAASDVHAPTFDVAQQVLQHLSEYQVLSCALNLCYQVGYIYLWSQI